MPVHRIVSLFLLLALSPLAWCETAIITSPHDTRQYAAFQLPNRLKVLVISDPQTDKAACALDVFAGHNADPEDRPGLAHFLEHMLFLGTGKYPEPDAWRSFITKHAGEQNAYTGFEHTNYFFDVDKDHLRQALDRFGQFFIAPIFAESYVDRERSVVDAEFHAKRKDDAWRRMAITRQVIDGAHPLSRFSVGNLTTLSDREGRDVRQDLIALYRRYYSANLMALVILGKEPVPVLGQWAREVFSAVPDRQAEPPRVTQPLFAPDRLPVRLITRPIENRRRLRLTFPVPPLLAHYKTKPLYYISHLLGHEGEGSLLSLLKARGWAEALSAGATYNHRDGALFAVSLTLTRKGMEKIDTITGLVFQTLALIETRGVRPWLFRELARLSDIDFLFQERIPSIDYVSILANLRHDYPTSDILRGSLVLEDYDEALIRKYLAALTPDNVLITVTDPDAEIGPSWSETPWFRAPYRVENLQPALLGEWRRAPISGQLAIPAPNPFIPEDLALASDAPPQNRSQDKPTRIVDVPGLTLWFHQDTSYRLPRANLYLALRSPIARDTPVHAVLTDLFVALVGDQLTEFTYPASLAGLDYDIYSHLRGISVRIQGYHDKQPRLLARILDTLKRPAFDQERFRIAKEELARKLRNKRKQPPYRQSVREMHDLLLEPRWTPEERLAALEPCAMDKPPGNRQQHVDELTEPHRRTSPCPAPVTLSELRRFVAEFLQRLSLVALSHGNVRESDALAMGELIQERLHRDAQPVDVPRGRVVKLTRGVSYLRQFASGHPDNAIAVYLQGSDRGFRQRAQLALLGQLIESAFFNRLRTEQRLGYLVSAAAYPLLEVPALLFLIQSPHADPATLGTRIERFLADHSKVLAAMTQTEFASHKAALAARILQQEESLDVRSNRYWREIDRGRQGFDSRERKAEAVRAITLAEIKDVYRDRILGGERRRLAVHAQGDRQKGSSPQGHPDREGGRGRHAQAGGIARSSAESSAASGSGKWEIIQAPGVFKRGRDTFAQPKIGTEPRNTTKER
uniref:Protease 3 n=1 Tax=Candidatus Kentrum sp. FM TaxID=2126340 RepID=A0A450VPS3_9GAMM|nr:MAG: Secreted Zn-dependent peptidases, insulinase-like [Candidatus Kentron sp. FM]VFJ49074.1 MAG: Secreted Zn-dependent peptidases, insulinase-like [Candidatus Kentron sp. FM]VFK06774.1 MAG: Secreted Zn-dependent peptidases, insulinase-like [Candidatus Kentron sp. FM]